MVGFPGGIPLGIAKTLGRKGSSHSRDRRSEQYVFTSACLVGEYLGVLGGGGGGGGGEGEGGGEGGGGMLVLILGRALILDERVPGKGSRLAA